MKRINSIDTLRALAILFMIYCHFVIFLSPLNDQYKWPYFFANHVIGDFAAPLFFFLVGISQVISKNPHLKKAFLIFLSGLIFSLIIRGPMALAEWDTLTFIGTTMFILHFLKSWKPIQLFLLAALIPCLSLLLRGQINYLSYWGDKLEFVPGISDFFPTILADPSEEYKVLYNFKDVFIGFFLVGYFPVFPWLSIPLVGMGVGKLIFSPLKKFNSEFMISFSGFIMIIVACSLAYIAQFHSSDPATSFVSILTFYPQSFSMLILQLGLCLFLFGLCRKFLDNKQLQSPWMIYLRLLSTFSLTIYFIHHMIVFWPIYIAGLLKGNIEYYYTNAMNSWMALLCATILLALLFPFLKFWQSKGNKYSLEWILKHFSA